MKRRTWESTLSVRLRETAVYLLVFGQPTLLGLWLVSDENARSHGLIGIPYLNWINAVLLGAALPIVLPRLRASLRDRVHSSLYLYLGILALSTCFSQLFGITPSPKSQLVSLVQLGVWASALVTMCFLVRSVDEYQRTWRSIDLSGLLIGLTVFAAALIPRFFGVQFGEFKDKWGVVRAFGPFGDQVGFALGCFALRAILRRQYLRVSLFITAILLTGTVGAFISLGVGIGWLTFFGSRLTGSHLSLLRRILVVGLLGTGIFVASLATSVGESSRTRIVNAMQGSGSVSQRIISMRLGLEVFFRNPMGVGYLGFRDLEDEFRFWDAFGGPPGNATYTCNNQLIQSATDGGVPAVIAFVGFVWLLYRRIEALARRSEGVSSRDCIAGLAWLVGLSVGNQSAVWFLPNNITSLIFFLVYGVLLSMSHWNCQKPQ